MDDAQSVATLFDSTTSKIQQLQQAFAELERHSAISLNLKWKELEEHFHGLEKSLKTRFDELEDQEKEYVTEVTEAQQMLEKQETAVVAKELASLERLQEKRDAALSVLFDKHGTSSLEPVVKGVNNSMTDPILKENSGVGAAKSGMEDVCPAEKGSVCIEPPTELMKLCEEMDAQGLHKFISDNHKNVISIREEIPVALKRAANPFSLVLDSLKGFYAGEILSSDGKKDVSLLGLRRTCLMLMESLEQLLADGVPDSLFDNQRLTSDIKEKAKVIAKEWKPKLDQLDIEATSGNSLEAHAFLQLLATFDIDSQFDQDEICKLIPAVTRRRQTVNLCRSLGLSHKMPGCLIEVLLNSGRQIEAVNLAYAFKLTEQFPPVPLLKAYLKEAKKVSQVKAGSMSPGAQNEMNERELSALKAVIKCIEEHKLEEQYPVDPLQKRILLLEKAKADKRRAAEAAKPQTKRPRANGSSYPRINIMPDKSFHRSPFERYPYAYDRQYVYAAETHHPTPMGSAPYTIPRTHSTFYGNVHQVQYQTAYLY
ncbi:unnamed protein product [Musa hybrid cultivar]